MKEQVRESVERVNLDKFTCKVGRLGLKVMLENFTQPLWVKYSIDPSKNFIGEIQDKGPIYKLIQIYQMNDGCDYTINLRVNNATPDQTEQEMQKMVAFFSIVNQFPQIMFSPILIREAAYKVGYRNERVIKEMQQSAILQKMTQMNALQQQQMGQGNGNGAPGNNQNANKSAIENRAPNPTNEIQQQLFRQV